MVRQKKRLGDMLVDAKLITGDQLGEALKYGRENSKKLGESLIELRFIEEKELLAELAKQLNLEQVHLIGIDIPSELIGLVNVSVLRKNLMIPYAYVKDSITQVKLAMADPMDMRAIDDFTIITNMQVQPVIAPVADILVTLDMYYGDKEAMKAAMAYRKELEQRQGTTETTATEDAEDVLNSPIVTLVRTMIEQAARQRASDIHIEALENRIRIRNRIDGTLYDKGSYDIHLLNAIIARVKIIGGMDITEKRKPQDGRITMVVDNHEYDIRVSILPTVFGEKCVMRLAEKKVLTRNKKELGFDEKDMMIFDRMLSNPNGIILVTGPTGSGKSTTLYTALSEKNVDSINIITVEDPVEANVDGINQVQVNPKADLTFATALRSILRQDPNVIMIGEIRDEETAEIAVQASITGHLVVSTLHTNSAAGTLTRLINMGIETYLLADAMAGVIAQRLVRRLCPNCKKKDNPTKEECLVLGDVSEETTIYRPVGCSQCNNTGYRGRIGIYEMLEVSPEIKNIIAHNGTTAEIKKKAIEEGMRTLLMGSRTRVLDGTTSMEELMKVSVEE
jgi:type IV pilus assembly protein PilB